MSTSISLLDQTFSTNDVGIMIFEPSVLFPIGSFAGGGIDDMVPQYMCSRRKVCKRFRIM